MSVANPPVYADPNSSTVDPNTGIWTAAAIDGICSDLAVLGGADGTLGIAGKENLLTNPGFEVWQRGNGPFTANLAYTADRWVFAQGGTSTVSITRDTTNLAPGSQYSLAAVYTHNAPSYLFQRNELYTQLTSKQVTFGCWVKCVTANAARLALSDNVTATFGAYHPGDGLWHLLTVTATISATATTVDTQLRLDASCTAWFDNATLVTGGSPLPYAPLHPAEEMARCQRYYEIIGTQGSSIIVEGIATAGSQTCRCVLPYKQTKAVTPTITRTGTWSLVNAAGQPTVTGDLTCCYLTVTSSAAGQFSAFNNVASAWLTIEGNP